VGKTAKALLLADKGGIRHGWMMNRRLLHLFLWLLSGVALSGEQVDMLSRNWTTRDGLPQDHVRAIARTKDGFLWLATDAGLSRFDGFDFKNYGLRDGLGAAAVLSLLQTTDGTLWAGTTGGGISELRDGRIVRTHGSAEGLPNGAAWRMAEDDQGGVWVTDRWGHLRFKDGRFTSAPGAPDQGRSWLMAVQRTHDGTLWVSFPRDIGLWRWKDGKWTEEAGGPPMRVTAICEDVDHGRLWMADDTGRLWCRDAGKWTSFPAAEGLGTQVSSLAMAPDGTLWVVYFRAGLRGFRDGKWITPVTRGEPFLELSETIDITPDGQIWLGTSTRGLFALAPARLEAVRVGDPSEGQAADFIGALLEERPGTFLAGTQGRGFRRVSGGISQPVETGDLLRPNSFINCMIRLPDHSILAGSHALVRFVDGQYASWAGPPPLSYDVWDLCTDRVDGGTWIGMGSGQLHHMKGASIESVDYGSNAVPVKGMAQQADGTLWIGTRGNGLFARINGKWRRYGRADGLDSEVIRVIFADATDQVWVGTAGGGLAMKHGDRFLSVNLEHGLPDDTVSQIHADAAGRLWLGTNRGLGVLSADEVSRLKSGRMDEFHPRVIDRFDGLLSEEFTVVPPVVTSDGRIAFATTQGFALLRPEDFQADQSVPPVFLEEVLVDGRAMEIKDGAVEVPPGSMRVEFRFTGLHFAAPDRLRFRNRLSGLEADWGETSTARNAVYRNVAPGSYRFEVSASTGNGLWSTRPAALSLHFRPHVWQTGWFRAAVVALVLGTVAFIVRRREQLRSARRIQQLERQQAVDGERARIARDLHDDVGASLTQVALLSQLARTNLTKRPEKAGQHVQQIFDTAKEVTRSLDEIVWAVNPQNDTLESFALFLGAFVQNYSHAAGLRCRFDVPGNLPAAPLDAAIRHHLYLATKEILHNTAKHAGATEIRLSLAFEPGAFLLTIEDDGRGFDSDAPGKPEADGLVNLQSRLKQIGGTCQRRSAAGKGTTVEMRVPLLALGGA
jgi:signal transduction histidine kinase/ligand-binding sensor domain-containing protein